MLEGFEPFVGKPQRSGSPEITISRRHVLFNKPAMEVMGNPAYAEAMVNKAEKKFAVVEGGEGGRRFGNKAMNRVWVSKSLVCQLEEISGTSFEEPVKVGGEYYPEEKALIFDLSNLK